MYLESYTANSHIRVFNASGYCNEMNRRKIQILLLRVRSSMRAIVFIALSLLLHTCDTVEPEATMPPFDTTTPAWVRTYGTVSDDRLDDMVVLPDGRIAFTFNRYSPNEGGYAAFFGSTCVGVDAEGRHMWNVTTDYSTERFFDAQGLRLIGAEDVMVRYGSNTLRCINADGTIVWNRTVPSKQLRILVDAVRLANGRIVISGQTPMLTSRIHILDDRDTTYSDTLSLGNMYAFEQFLTGAGDGTVIVVGKENDANEFGKQMFLSRIDVAARTSTRFAENSVRTRWLYGISDVVDGTFCVLGNDGLVNLVSFWHVSGAKQWEREVGTDKIAAVHLCSDKSVLLAGSAAVDGGRRGFVRKLSSADGTLLWERHIDGPTVVDSKGRTRYMFSTRCERVSENPDGKIIVAGTSDGWTSAAQDVFLLRLHAHGIVDTTFGR